MFSLSSTVSILQISLWNCRLSKILPNHRAVQLRPAYYSRSGVVLKYSLVSTPGIQEKACPSFHTAPFSSFDLTSQQARRSNFSWAGTALWHIFCSKCQINYSAFVSPLIYKIPCTIDTPKKLGRGGESSSVSQVLYSSRDYVLISHLTPTPYCPSSP
jgi:hypothetical protein